MQILGFWLVALGLVTGAYAQTSDSLATYIAAAIRNNPAVISGV